jgi:predicted RNA binding protein YcfA (HicA-like mRNA interferase family)
MVLKNFREWLQLNEASNQYIESKEYEKRLKAIGWSIKENGSHRTAFAPDKEGMVTWSINNWEKNWQQIARDLIYKAKPGGYSALTFVWQNPFRIPPNFDQQTQQIVEKPKNLPHSITVLNLLQDPSILIGKEIEMDDNWKRVDFADHAPNGTSIEVMFDDGFVTVFDMNDTVNFRS